MTIHRNILYFFFRDFSLIYPIISIYMHTLQRSTERGETRISRLQSFHSFSFGEYYDPTKMGFGPLRVLNDDTILGGT